MSRLSAVEAAEPAGPPTWKAVVLRISSAEDALSRRLEEIRKDLKSRVRAERPDLMPRLDPAPLQPRPAGYGMLPTVRPDNPDWQGEDVPERTYDLGTLLEQVEQEQARLDALASRVRTPGDPAPLVEDYLARVESLRYIDREKGYHELWQAAASGSRGRPPTALDLLQAFRLWRSTPADAAAAAEVLEAGRKLEREAVRFSSVPWHVIERAPDGLVLRVRLKTDIEDDVFLSTLAAATEAFWNGSAAMKEAGLRVAMAWDWYSKSMLYPEGAPERGAAVDLRAHLARFGQGYVVTTGAASLHIAEGRGIVLGPEAITGRTFAHELGHFFGFTDGYFRAFEGSKDDPDGFVIREITPFPGDLMSDSHRGRVTTTMVRRLLDAYLPQRPVQ